MSEIVIAVHDDGRCGSSPIMPYVGERFDGRYFSRLCKLYLEAALLRCGFEIFDVSRDALDPAELAMRVNRRNADALITVSYASFGSGKSFNGVHGFCCSCDGRFYDKSKTFCEDICAKLLDGERPGEVRRNAEVSAVACPSVKVEVGYATYFDEAKLIYDPDFAIESAERIALGVCEHFDVPYIRRDDISSYPLLGLSRRGKKVKMLQCLLAAFDIKTDIDGAFGSSTERAVKALCAANGLGDGGAATPAVWRSLLLAELPELSFGATGNAVLYIQRKLKSKLYQTPTDGKFGKKTFDALGEFLTDAVGGGFALEQTDKVDADIYRLLTPFGGGKPRLF